MLARRNNNAETRSGRDIDVRINTALTDELKLRQPVQQRRLNFGALADENEAFSVLQALGKQVGVLHVIVPDLNFVTLQFFKAR
jgi:hypothetical protein